MKKKIAQGDVSIFSQLTILENKINIYLFIYLFIYLIYLFIYFFYGKTYQIDKILSNS